MVDPCTRSSRLGDRPTPPVLNSSPPSRHPLPQYPGYIVGLNRAGAHRDIIHPQGTPALPLLQRRDTLVTIWWGLGSTVQARTGDRTYTSGGGAAARARVRCACWTQRMQSGNKRGFNTGGVGVRKSRGGADANRAVNKVDTRLGAPAGAARRAAGGPAHSCELAAGSRAASKRGRPGASRLARGGAHSCWGEVSREHPAHSCWEGASKAVAIAGVSSSITALMFSSGMVVYSDSIALGGEVLARRLSVRDRG